MESRNTSVKLFISNFYAEQIANMRKEMGLKQLDLAKEFGIRQCAYSRAENYGMGAKKIYKKLLPVYKEWVQKEVARREKALQHILEINNQLNEQDK